MKIFAYTKGAGMTEELLQKLTEAGYVPVPVRRMNCIKIIEPLPDAEGSAVFAAALEAVRDTETFSDVKRVFAKRLTKRLLTLMDDNPQATEAVEQIT